MGDYYKGHFHIFTNRSNGIVKIKAGQGEYLNVVGTALDLDINYTIPNSYIQLGTATTLPYTARGFGSDIAYDPSTGNIHIMDRVSTGADNIYNSSFVLVSRLTVPSSGSGSSDSVSFGTSVGYIGKFGGGTPSGIFTVVGTFINPESYTEVEGQRMDVNLNNNVVYFTFTDSAIYYNLSQVATGVTSIKSVFINNTFFGYVAGTNSFIPFYKTSNPTVLDSKMYFGLDVSNAKMNENLLVVVFDLDASLRQKVSIYDVSSNNTYSFVRKANLYIQHSTSTDISKRNIRKIVITSDLILLQQGDNTFSTTESFNTYKEGNRQFYLVKGPYGWVVDSTTGSQNGYSALILNNEIVLGNPNSNVVRRIPYSISLNSTSGSYSSTYVTANSEGLTFFSTGYITFDRNLTMNSYFSNYTFVENLTASSLVLSDTTSDTLSFNATSITITNLTTTTLSSSSCVLTNMLVTNANISTISNNISCTNFTSSNIITTNLTLSGILNVTGYVSALMPYCKIEGSGSTWSYTYGNKVNFIGTKIENIITYSSGYFTVTETGFYSIKCNLNTSVESIISVYKNDLLFINYLPSTNHSNNSFISLTAGDIISYYISQSCNVLLTEILIIKMF